MNSTQTNVSIQQDNAFITSVEILHTEPETQVATLKALFASNAQRRAQPGFVAVAVLRSLDGLRIANYLQFQDQASLETAEASTQVRSSSEQYRARADQTITRHFDVRFVHRAEHFPASVLQTGINCAAINEVTTTPAHQEELLGFMTGVDSHARIQPGYLASNIHASQDGQRIINVVQFENAEIMLEGLERVMADVTRERTDVSLEGVGGLGTTDIHVYEIVNETSAIHYEETTSSISAQSFLNEIPERLTSTVRNSINGVFALEFSGTEAGTYTIDARRDIGHGLLPGRPEEHHLKASATIRTSSENFVKLMRGELSPMTAMMTGRIRLSGDMQAARGLQKIFGR
jgi:SCP-2 sterol transfer family/Antibiotic biosynthesis monooxygenase